MNTSAQREKTATCVVIGSTGSIGTQTLQVIDRLSARGYGMRVVGLAARSHPSFIQQLKTYRPAGYCFERPLTGIPETARRYGAVEEMLDALHPDMTMIASSGGISLSYALKALETSKRLCLANKESVVLGGRLIPERAKALGKELIPVDSEHSGLFQLLLGTDRKEIRKVYITASGGALRDWDESRKENASVEQVLRHPNWQMGAKITVDSATLMNKALEMIEAKFLFDLPKETIAAAFCHNSFVHAVLAYRDGHFKIHAGPPDMRIPIAYSLTYPERVSVLEENGTAVEDPRSLFEPMILKPADTAVHPPLRLAQAVIDAPSSLRIALNAANEAAVLLFLQRKVTFGELTRLVERTVLSQEAYEVTELSQILELHEGIKRRVELDYSC